MSTPEFVPRLQSARPFHSAGARPVPAGRSTIWSHSVRVTLFWAFCDTLCVMLAAALAVRVRLGNFITDDSVFQTQSMLSSSPWVSLFYLCWFPLALILVSRPMHLYAPIELRNT